MSAPPAPFRPAFNNPPVHAFGGVPTEIALRIIEFITRKRDLASLGLTCKDLRLLTLPILYEHIYVSETKWSTKDLSALTSLSNPALNEIRDITVVRPSPSSQYFYSNWSLLFQFIPQDQLRSVRFVCSATGEMPSDFLDYMLWNQCNLVALDLRWLPLSVSCAPIENWRLPDLSMLTSITISVQCNSHINMAEAAATMLSSAVNLRHLSGSCCTHNTGPLTAQSFILTAFCLTTWDIKFRLKTLTLTGCPKKHNCTAMFCFLFKDIIDFSELQSLTLRECMRKPGVFLSMIADLHPDNKIRDIVIEGGHFYDTEICDLQKFRNLQHLVLAGVEVLYASGPHAGMLYHTRAGFIKICHELSLQPWTLRTLCLEVCCNGRSGVTMSLGKNFSALGEDMYEVFTKLVSNLPALEELWVSLPIIATQKRDVDNSEVEMQSFLNTIAKAPRLRLICNLRPHKRRHMDDAPHDTLVDFYEGDPWLANVAYTMFRKSASANPALRVVAFGYLPVGHDQGRIKAFIRRPKLIATARFETVIEEVSAKELFLEEDFYFWDMFEQYEFEGQYGSPKLIADEMDMSA